MQIVHEIVHEETYEFTPSDGSPPIFIRSGALRDTLMADHMDKVIDLVFPECSVAEIYATHGIEPERMKTMTAEEAAEPVIVGQLGKTFILIDGGHRRLFWALRGVQTLRGWNLPAEFWRLYEYDPRSIVGYVDKSGMGLPQRRNK